MCVMFSCVFVTCPYGYLGQVWYLMISIPDLCLLLYFFITAMNHVTLQQHTIADAYVSNTTILASFTLIFPLESDLHCVLSK